MSTAPSRLIPKLTAEFLGTFFLALTISMVAVQTPGMDGALIPVAIGLTLAALVYAFGPISGAHFNPAVTIGLYLAGRHPKAQVAPYIVAECLGAAMAAILAIYLGSVDGITPKAVAATPGLIAEGLWTFLLVCVILQITSKRNEGNQWFGMVVGLTILGGAYVMGPVSGAAFNPAVWIALCLEGALAWSDWLVFVVAPCVGGGLAAAAQGVLEPDHAKS